MRIKGWIRVVALVMIALAVFAAVESATCADDFGVCAESGCCGCVHSGVVVQAPINLASVDIVFSVKPSFEAVPSRGTDPLVRPPNA